MSTSSSFNPSILVRAIKESFTKLNPRVLWTNPVMLVVEILAVLTTYFAIRDMGGPMQFLQRLLHRRG